MKIHILYRHIVIKYCEKVSTKSRMVAAQLLLYLIEIRDSFGHFVSLLSFNEVCEITVVASS